MPSAGLPHAVRAPPRSGWCGSGSPASTSCAAACTNKPMGIAAAAAIDATEFISWARLLFGIEAGDERSQVTAAWVAVQEPRDDLRLSAIVIRPPPPR